MPDSGKFLLAYLILFLIGSGASLASCKVHSADVPERLTVKGKLKPGAWRTELYFPMLRDRKFALVCNHTATIGLTHLVDSLVRAGLRPERIFAPEHGFRGDLPDGEHFGQRMDRNTGLPILSLYGTSKKPRAEDLRDLDFVIFDIQDVGVRCYTYLSTLHYVMEACAENGVAVIVLDRPNPNGHFIDGPVMEAAYFSFVGLHPVPLVYGMTIGEYAKMINGEGWLAEGKTCDLTVIGLDNYHRETPYALPERPSPNLPNMRAIYNYPSLCFLEGTSLSVGRGTDLPFQVVGHPDLENGDTYFLPVSRAESTNPPLKNRECRGFEVGAQNDEVNFRKAKVDLGPLIQAWNDFPDHSSFFLTTGFFEKIAGTDQLRTSLLRGATETQIRESWKDGIERFKVIRAKYLIYNDMER